jgi:hypothetical protein
VTKVATLAMIVAMTPAVAHAQCSQGDWQCWHNHEVSKAKADLEHAMTDLERSSNDFMQQINRDVVRRKQMEILELQRRDMQGQTAGAAAASAPATSDSATRAPVENASKHGLLGGLWLKLRGE